jgi:SAM-dependent methyltransferase
MKSEISHARLEEKSRRRKTDKILSILKNFKEIKKCDLLDIGTGSGQIANFLSKELKNVTSVDVRDERQIKEGYEFKLLKNEEIKLNKKFDIILSNHVIEHVQDINKHINLIKENLKKNGIVYLATPNKYWIMEPHFKLPFLGMLPRKIAAAYLKLIKNKIFDVKLLSFNNLKKLLSKDFLIENITIEIIKNPEKYQLDTYKNIQSIIKIIPKKLLILLNPIMPTYILILKNKAEIID